MTVKPALDEPYFEMENAVRWFSRHYTKVRPDQLMSLCALEPPPGYADLQEQELAKSRWNKPQWHHFRLTPSKGAPALAVVLETRKDMVLSPLNISPFAAVPMSLFPVTWRVWLYQYQQGRGWVCLDPSDDSHEVVRRLRGKMILEALR